VEEIRPRPAVEGTIVRAIADRGPAVVALSGGVDSSLVASLAWEALGQRSLAVTITSSAVAPREIERARGVAAGIGIRHVVVEAEPLQRDEYRENGPTRCYACRTVETEAILRIGRAEGFEQYLDGLHAGDLGEVRPGIRAMDEAGFLHPLLDAGWGKAEVRAAARRRGLPNWDLPSDACLASRVAHGLPITSELLGRIAAGEELLLERGFRRVRLRVRRDGASIEVDPLEVPRLMDESIAGPVREALRSLGFATVSIDPLGYQGGRTLPVVAR
jgi:pyridinium-3,5-biscarboxylic acid mononucleotide sulfurtransferase